MTAPATRRRFARAAAAGMAVAATGVPLVATGAANPGRGLLAAGLAAAGAGGGALWSLRRPRLASPTGGEWVHWTRFLVGVAGGVLAAGFAAPRGIAASGAAALAGGGAASLLSAGLARLRSVTETLARGRGPAPDAAALLRRATAPADEARLVLEARIAALDAALDRVAEARRRAREVGDG